MTDAVTGPVRPCALAARASRHGETVAESAEARISDEAEGPPRLWFPRGALRSGAADVTLAAAPPGCGLDGYISFDPGEVALVLVDPMDGAGERDVTVKRFPVWGDADDLVAILDVRPEGRGRFTSVVRGYNGVRPVVEGSQMLGQAIVAAGRHRPGSRVVSAHMVFFRGADALEPLHFELDERSSGRTFCALSTTVAQRGRAVAGGTLLLDATAEDLVRHQAEAPAVPGPYASEPYDMGVTGRDLRVVAGAYRGDVDAPVGPAVIDAWVRFHSVADDPPLHAGLLAQFTGHMPIAAALRPHAGVGQDQAHRTISTAVNAISLSIHRDIRADRWMLYHHESTFAGDGMTHAQCRVHDESGTLLASFSVDAMVRAFPGDGAPLDERRAL